MSPIRMSKIEAGVRMVLDFHKAFNRHDVAGMMKYLSDDCVYETTSPPPDGTVYAGKERITRYWQDFFQESPKAHIEIEEVFNAGFRCISRWRYEWLNEAGVKLHVRGVDIFRIRDGAIREHLSYSKG